MAKFIELTQREGAPIIVNVEQIVFYNSHHLVTTKTNFDVKEDAKEISRLLSLADCLLLLSEKNTPKSKELTNLHRRGFL